MEAQSTPDLRCIRMGLQYRNSRGIENCRCFSVARALESRGKTFSRLDATGRQMHDGFWKISVGEVRGLEVTFAWTEGTFGSVAVCGS